MKSTDQLGNIIEFDQTPESVVSLVPSITELLCDMGLRSKIVGCTKFCVHPKNLKKEVTIIGGTKRIHLDHVARLTPDIIIGNKEENSKEDITKLREIGPIWMSDIKTIEDSYDMINSLADIMDTSLVADQIIWDHKAICSHNDKELGTVAYLIWNDPLMTIGGDTYIHSMLQMMGYDNVYSSANRYPKITLEELQSKAPQHIFLSSEPFPFKLKHVESLQDQLNHSSIHLVDGEFFSWYGSRLIKCSKYPQQLLDQIQGH